MNQSTIILLGNLLNKIHIIYLGASYWLILGDPAEFIDVAVVDRDEFVKSTATIQIQQYKIIQRKAIGLKRVKSLAHVEINFNRFPLNNFQ